MKNFLLVVFLFHSFLINAQSNIPIGTWRTHFSYNRVNQVLVEDNRVFAVSDNGLFVYDKEDGSLTTISKINGLQEDDISAIGYSQALDKLIIGFESGNVDVLDGNEIVNLDLVSKSQVLGSKRINHITTTDNLAFISTAYGLLRMDLNRIEITETYRQLGEMANQVSINQALIVGDTVMLATAEGVIASNYSNGTNLLNPVNWKRDSLPDGIPLVKIDFISEFDSKPAAFINEDGLYIYENGIWNRSSAYQGVSLSVLKSNNNNLVTINEGVVQVLYSDLSITEFVDNAIDIPLDADLDGNSIWVGSINNGLVTNVNWGFESFNPSGPNTNQVAEFFTLDNLIISMPGGPNESFQPQNNDFGYNTFANGNWQSSSQFDDEFLDITECVYFSNTDSYYFSSFGYGIMRQSGQNPTIFYNTSNSSLEQVSLEENSIYVTDMIDSDEGLWAINYNAVRPLHLFDGSTWQSYTLPENRITQIINSNLYLWMVIDPTAGGGLLVFDKSTEEARILTDQPGNGGLPSRAVNAIEIDKNGEIWIGTSSGVATMSSLTNIIGTSVDVFKPIFENRFLLRDEEITSIKIDGGNRKWIGTNNGVWLFNNDVNELLANFNIENSPLPSNSILALDIIPTTGEVFIGTPSGIVSYRSDATEAVTSHQNVKVFPNPVSKEFQGLVGISGLAENANVKITDSNGRLIWDTRAAGGTASWNVLDYNGRRASTGVYFVFSSSDDGEETFVAKIAIVN
ncbi:type IX secretion system anionic LPS delivery protein PorZ [Fulvivirga lutea]|uniref:PQQ-binding-like beta-propeller repeat protein n=1 Tax=Fulvivirga lutea TaxID=2810512 RepID=A0A975A1G3_9BACT|nr:T9SS type A sorting domain-containing protein [Fulvivirga lutea]QSE97796.1 PQQ-binding-like beta-propeller repeat protein [Fulvivirga lutea]